MLSIASKQIGEVVTASVMNPHENRGSRGKARPVILIREVGGQFDVMGLTTSGAYATGVERTPVPDPAALGLEAPCFFWGDRLTRVSRIDIRDHIGWIDAASIEAMRALGIRLSPDAWDALEASAANALR